MRHPKKVELDLPEWLLEEIERLPDNIPDPVDRMRLIVRFSKLNFENNTGGPFAAGVFEKQSGKLISIGVNRVVPCHASAAHAEIMAILFAQMQLGTFDLGKDGIHRELVVNGRPCAMCFGSIPWSGVRSVVIGATGDQIESLTGFDEGPIHPEWKQQLIERGIAVTENVLAEEACQVLREFAATNPVIYNGRQGD